MQRNRTVWKTAVVVALILGTTQGVAMAVQPLMCTEPTPLDSGLSLLTSDDKGEPGGLCTNTIDPLDPCILSCLSREISCLRVCYSLIPNWPAVENCENDCTLLSCRCEEDECGICDPCGLG